MDSKIGEVIGTFFGYVRRSKYSNSGLTTQIFGENGENADNITALHLTKFQEVPVKVSVWEIKNALGASKKNNGQYPLITSFISKIRRPKPSLNGQTALFYSKNGEDADNANILNETKYVDSLVLVQLQLVNSDDKASDINTTPPNEELENADSILTEKQKKEKDRLDKILSNAHDFLLKSGFYIKEDLLKKLGTDENYREWCKKQDCCYNRFGEQCNCKDSISYALLKGREYQYIPLCNKHVKIIESDIVGNFTLLNELKSLLKQKKTKWALERLKYEIGLDNNEMIPPLKLTNWLIYNDLIFLLPKDYSFYTSS